MKDTRIGYAILESSVEASDMELVSDNKRRVLASGTVQEAEADNRNGRCYSLSELVREINCDRTRELLEHRQMNGEYGHPLDDSVIRQQTIDPKNVCVEFRKFWVEGNLIKAQFQGTNNNYGEYFDQDLRDGKKPAFSLRALGTLENIGGHNMVKNLKFITYDSVIYPSHKKAYTEQIITESAVSKDAFDSVNDKGKIIPITNEQVISYIKQESANIKSILSQFDTLYESMKLVNRNRDVQLVTKEGAIFVINLENYIQDEIRDYCVNKK